MLPDSFEPILQPPLYVRPFCELNVLIGNLDLGGAQKIVIDWAARIPELWKIRLIVLRDSVFEYSVPPNVEIVRIGGIGRSGVFRMRQVAEQIAKSSNPVILSHLVRREQRDLFESFGCFVFPVLHNARTGWIETVEDLNPANPVISVSHACAKDLRADGWEGYVSTIHHIPRVSKVSLPSRFPENWKIPHDAVVFGMIGGVKSQKNYFRALRVLKEFNNHQKAYLVILGGPVGEGGRDYWHKVVREIERLGLRNRVCMPGFVLNAEQYIQSFNVFLNTSEYEGLSIATLESLLLACPVVASSVGGQGEVSSDGLFLVPTEADDSVWVRTLLQALQTKFEIPKWATAKNFRLWTLHQLAKPFVPSSKVLFVTANLNSGGAQRSLVNLTRELNSQVDLSVMVAGSSTSSNFFRELRDAGVCVERTSEEQSPFDHAEAVIQKVCTEKIGLVIFWNVDSKLKLLLAKVLGFTNVKFVDVSPGEDSFLAVQQSLEFQKQICFSLEEFYKRLDKLVLKFDGEAPLQYHGEVRVIPNGVAKAETVKVDYSLSGVPKIVVNGRIAPSKFLVEIVEAVRLVWKTIPNLELQIYGASEPRDTEYYNSVKSAAGSELGRKIFLCGPHFNTKNFFPNFDAFVVLGLRQGCPNALLEALSTGIPCIANDDGGTREQVIDGQTGLLVSGTDPVELAGAIVRLLSDRELAKRLGENGRAHVENKFSMELMRLRYLGLIFESLVGKPQIQKVAKAAA